MVLWCLTLQFVTEDLKEKLTILCGSKLGHGVYVKPGPGFPYMVLYMLVGNNNEAKVVCCLPSKEVKNSLRCTLTPVM